MRRDETSLLPRVHLLVFVVLAGVTGCRHTTADPPTLDPDVARAAVRLEARGDADSLAAAALLSRLSDPSASLALARRAVEAAPQRTDLLWMLIRLCADEPTCSPVPWERQLQALDPGNAAPHLGDLQRATESGDLPAQQAALQAIQHAERLDFYWTQLAARTTRAAARGGGLGLRTAEAYGLGVSVFIPPLQTLMHRCQGEALTDTGVRDRCRQIAQVFLRGDTVIAEMLGVALAKRTFPEDSAQWAAADAARREYDYRRDILAKKSLWMIVHPDRYLTLLESNRREHDLLRQEIVLMGLPPDPPA